MKIRFFDPAKGYASIKSEIDSAIQDVLARGDLILRKDVEIFEKNFAEYIGTKYCITCANGTDAIYLALKACGTKQGDEVVVPAYTFKSTIGAIVNAGATPILIDMDGKWNHTISSKTRIFMPVHIAGEVMETTAIKFWEGESFGLWRQIEDACQAVGAIKNPTSLAQCWSFYPAKSLGCYGDAGAITTNDEKVYEYVKEARNHFKGTNKEFGVNSRMDNLQAAILNVKFKHLPEYIARREAIANMYYDGLRGVELPNKQEGRVYQDFIVRTPKRDALYDFLKEQGIETLKNEYPFPPEYPKPPLTAKYEAETLRLPCNETLTNEEVQYVIEKINSFFS